MRVDILQSPPIAFLMSTAFSPERSMDEAKAEEEPSMAVAELRIPSTSASIRSTKRLKACESRLTSSRDLDDGMRTPRSPSSMRSKAEMRAESGLVSRDESRYTTAPVAMRAMTKAITMATSIDFIFK